MYHMNSEMISIILKIFAPGEVFEKNLNDGTLECSSMKKCFEYNLS